MHNSKRERIESSCHLLSSALKEVSLVAGGYTERHAQRTHPEPPHSVQYHCSLSRFDRGSKSSPRISEDMEQGSLHNSPKSLRKGVFGMLFDISASFHLQPPSIAISMSLLLWIEVHEASPMLVVSVNWAASIFEICWEIKGWTLVQRNDFNDFQLCLHNPSFSHCLGNPTIGQNSL